MGPPRTDWFVGLTDWGQLGRVAARMGVAALLGGLIGFERECGGKAAGLRTHMLVAIGSCLFVVAALETGAELDHMMRVVQGIAAGIGFLGAGAILKMSEERKIHGLTTAANIWVTAALGMAIGFGMFWPAAVAVALAMCVLWFVRWVEPRTEISRRGRDEQ